LSDARIAKLEKVLIITGILCAILAFCLLIVMGFYTSTINIITASKDSQISNLNAIIDHDRSAFQNLTSKFNALQEEVWSTSSLMYLRDSTVWVNNQTVTQTAGSYTNWGTYGTLESTLASPYCGYISVHVDSTTNNTYVRTLWISNVYGVSYDNQTVVGVSGTATFPVLVGTNLEIRVGNTNAIDNATETVTITYYY